MTDGVVVVADVLDRLSSLRQHQRDGKRSPHKPLLVLLALGRLAATGSSRLPWSAAETRLAELIGEFGPPSKTGAAQSAAYPFTRLRADGVWTLDRDVEMDNLRPLRAGAVTGQFEASLEAALRSRPEVVATVARALVDSHFPPTVGADVLAAVGFDPEAPALFPAAETATERRRRATWRADVLEAWDRQCAFCGYDGQAAGVPVGIEAAHVRWFAVDGPDDLDNGLALCMLHHKLFDRGMLGLDDDRAVVVSSSFSARTPAGRAVYDLHGRRLAARPGTPLPAHAHVSWHRDQVFKGMALAV
ncbi:HNH endonuclease [Geodermatophilus sp. YIM 151500]|uniref:phosphorothioated DNA-binding restriction endonuclease n=1 Tax=Geodermatophilus sp. YIM 151500 TaxID=2984531 RepID=UPI0021E45D38|nr:HNH endonuclease [Geodermatophilus sp. YIM 151500]MCV2488225.1 HNH endonuclease [Geodermatophilus sp. YIM 151500]